MGRKPSNVYDFFERVEPDSEINTTSRIKYECKTCKKSYAANATKLAEHLRITGCATYTSNQGTTTTVPRPSHESVRNNHTFIDLSNPLLVPRMATLSTCDISDALDALEVSGYLPDLNCFGTIPATTSFCGSAYTVEMKPPFHAEKKDGWHYVDAAPRDSILVIQTSPECTRAVAGGLVALRAKERGVGALITNGNIRDVHELGGMDFPVFATGVTAQGRAGSVVTTSVGTDIIVNGQVIRNGDIIRGDVNGVVVIPLDLAMEVLHMAEIREAEDEKIGNAIRDGESFQDAIAAFRTKLATTTIV